jgi:hypothetical protein
MNQTELAKLWLRDNIELFLAVGYSVYLQHGRGGLFLTFTEANVLPDISYISLTSALEMKQSKGFGKSLNALFNQQTKQFIKDCNSYDPEIQCLAIIEEMGYRIKSETTTPAECYRKYGAQLSDFVVVPGKL